MGLMDADGSINSKYMYFMYGLESYSPSLVWLDVFVIDISLHGNARGGLSPPT